VSPLILLMGLLALAYLGSLLAGDRRLRGFGLPSGAEYVALGFLLGPAAFDFVDRSNLEIFDPIAHVALGWIALVLGLAFGVSLQLRKKRERALHVAGGLVFACVTSLFSAAAVTLPLLVALAGWTDLPFESRTVIALGAGLACAETTRESVRWVTERYRAKGPLASAVAHLAEADDLIPVLLLAGCFALHVSADAPWKSAALAPLFWGLVTIGVGLVFGVLATLMIGRELKVDETWGTLVGCSVLATGLMTRLGLSAVSTLFAMGFALALCSPHRQTLLAMLEPTERIVLHPVLLLAGARVSLRLPGLPLGLLAGVVLVGRVFAKSFTGAAWQAVSKKARKAGPLFGLGLLSSGTLSMTIGLACALRFPGVVGDAVLAAAAASIFFGEVVAPYTLQLSLRAAGEMGEPAAVPAPAAPAPPARAPAPPASTSA
jgi:hypothetical protein